MGKSALRNKKKTFTASANKISRATNEIAIALTLQQSARPENPQRFSPRAGATELLKAIEDLRLAPPFVRGGFRRREEVHVRAPLWLRAWVGLLLLNFLPLARRNTGRSSSGCSCR